MVANCALLLGNDNYTRRWPSGCYALAKILGHGISVVRYDNSILFDRQFEQVRIFGSSHPGRLHINDVNRRFAREQAIEDI